MPRPIGIRIIPIAEFHARGAEDVMAEAREIVGRAPIYVTYDIDFVDPTFAPGTGTPEVGGPTSWQALQVARGLRGRGCGGGGSGGGVAALRCLGRDGLAGRVADVRDAVRDGRAGRGT